MGSIGKGDELKEIRRDKRNFIRQDKINLEKMRADTNSRLKNFSNQKNIHLILNDNIKENHLDIKKLHLNRKSNSIFAKNLLNFY